MNVTKQEQVAAKTEDVTDGDREFMHDVVEVNIIFAGQYATLAAENPVNVRGINYNPNAPPFNPDRHLPTLCGVPTRDPGFRNRIIGNVKMEDCLKRLNEVMGSQISLRADEGEPFVVGSIAEISDHATFHALDHTQLSLGQNGKYGLHSIVHGGDGPKDHEITKTGSNLALGAYAVFFRSSIGDNSTIGEKSLVQDSILPANTVVPPRQVWLEGKFKWNVEW